MSNEFKKYPLSPQAKRIIWDNLNKILEGIPCKLDRVTGTEEQWWWIEIYGWIPHAKAHYKDFVVFRIDKENLCQIDFTTSSAQYSKQINDNISKLMNIEMSHSTCVKASDFFKD